jgi:hypothetical protein
MMWIGLIILIVSAAVFWLAYVYVTQDHNQSWKLMILWVIIADILRLPAKLLLEMSNTTFYSVVSEILGLAIMYAFLYFVLTYKYSVHSIVKKIKILTIHLIVRNILGWTLFFN